MEKHDLTHLDNKIKELLESLTSLADEGGFKEFITTIHKAGFTSVAEHSLLTGIADSMLAQAKALLGLKQVLLTGAAKVELNPQPLPPKVGVSRGATSG